MRVKSLALILLILLANIASGKPPVTVHGSNNQIIGRTYQSGTTYRYYGKNYQALGSSRQSGSYHFYYGSNNQYLGKVYNNGK